MSIETLDLAEQPPQPNQQPEGFDWDFAEAQFSQSELHSEPLDPVANERPAESEIYGRSLSTVYRLGAFAMGKLDAEVTQSPEAAQAKDEFFTSVEEGFGTDMELGRRLEVRDFDKTPRHVVNGKVLAKDEKTPISYMTKKGVKSAVKTTKKDKRFLPQLVRSKWDHENAKIVDGMGRGETSYNTRIVASPYPEEAAEESGSAYWRRKGYVPHLRRGFIQFYYASDEGVIGGSLSFDGSNKERLREIFGKHGVEIPENERTDNWLQYAITANLPEHEAKQLAIEIADEAGDPEYDKTTNTVEVTDDHRTIMDTVFNQSYVHACESLFLGQQTRGLTRLVSQLDNNVQYFNDDFKNAFHRMKANQTKFTDADFIAIHELLVYSTIEMMRALHLQKMDPGEQDDLFDASYLDAAQLQHLSVESFQDILGSYGAEGARNNRVYSACGLSISLGEGDPNNPSSSPQNAFGGKDCPEVKNGQRVKCPHCKKIVSAIVPNKDTIYCSNKKCKMVAPGLAT